MPALLAALGLVGAALRLRQFFADRSLWLDESFLALNLLRDGVPNLLGQLDFNQAAAPGFLVLEKAVEAIDRAEESLRLPPLLFGLAALVLALPVARRVCSSPTARFVAYALIALSPGLVYYSSELKQYSADVASALAVTWAALELARSTKRRTALAAAITGVAAVLLSHPAIFVVAGDGAVLIGAELRRRRLSRIRSAVVAAWALAAGAVLAHTLSTSQGVLSSYHSSVDLGPGTRGTGGYGAHALKAVGTAVLGDVGLPTNGHAFELVTVPLAVVGLFGAILLLRARPLSLLLVATPAVVTLVANATSHYPVTGRTVLFLAPAASMVIAEGVGSLAHVSRRAGPAVALALTGLALAYPIRTDANVLRTPTKEETRPLLNALATEARPGDRFFLTYPAQYAIAYYDACGCTRLPDWDLVPRGGSVAQWSPAVETTAHVLVQPYQDDDEAAYLRQVRLLPPGRIWLIVSHAGSSRERAFLYDHLQRAFAARGSRLATIRAPGAVADLYALR